MAICIQCLLSVGGHVFIQSHPKLGENSLCLGGREHEWHHIRCGSIIVVVVILFAGLLIRELVWRNVLWRNVGEVDVSVKAYCMLSV